jgi:autophagy-related protein 18
MHVAGKYNSGLQFVNFNQDYTCISVGTPDGFKIFSCDPFANCYQGEGGTGIVEMLFCTSLVAIVGSVDHPSRSPRTLQIINTKTKALICELFFVTPILGIKLNKKRIAVILETKIHIYDINNLKILHSIDTVPNPKGVCALSPCSKNCFLAYPASQQNGNVYIYDALSLQTVSEIAAHKGSVAALAINQDGTLLATASEKGTVIRVHSVPSGNKSWTFRRGTYPAAIASLAFSTDGRLLAAASDTGTVHIFKLEEGAGGLGIASYLPEMFSQVWEPQRDIAHIRLPNIGVPALCGIVADTTNPSCARVMVLTADGFYYMYMLDTNAPQHSELKLAQEFSLLVDMPEPPSKVL